MTSLQDVCSQLMKPAKDLAEWNFPLAQILEDYYTLLGEPCDINFSEAALVLQNSANVFVRRVEYLYQETAALSKSLQDHEDEQEKDKKGKSHRKSRKPLIDFKNFDLVDFSNEILKKTNENTKMTRGEREIKLISQRFPQLENISRRKFSEDIIDVQGEIIGKKYDFRCNQQLTLSRMLIEEVTPLDFCEEEPDYEANNTQCTENSNGFADYSTFDACLSDDGETSRDADILNPIQDSGYETIMSCSNPDTLNSRVLSMFSQSLNDSSPNTDNTLMSLVADLSVEFDSNPNDSGIEHSRTPESMNNESDGVDCEQNSETNSEKNSNNSNITETGKEAERCGRNSESENLLDNDLSATNKILRTRDSTETDAGYTSGDPDDLAMNAMSRKLRKSNKDQLLNGTDSMLTPIPVDSVVPDKIPRCRREFKLPCNIALLKTVPKLRKRRLTDAVRKRGSKKFLTDEKSKQVEVNEAKEIEKLFKERLQLQLNLDRHHYSPIFCDNTNLIGFVSRIQHSELIRDHRDVEIPLINRSRNHSLSESISLPSSSSPLPTSPASSIADLSDPVHMDELETIVDVQEFINLGQTHQQRIERKMQELKKQFDDKNHSGKETSKWLEAVEALKAVEKRPSFHVDEYEKRIIASLKAKNEHQVEFHEIAEQEEPGNIARLFVASLHLANTYNVELNVVNKEDNSELNLKLLDAEIPHNT